MPWASRTSTQLRRQVRCAARCSAGSMWCTLRTAATILALTCSRPPSSEQQVQHAACCYGVIMACGQQHQPCPPMHLRWAAAATATALCLSHCLVSQPLPCVSATALCLSHCLVSQPLPCVSATLPCSHATTVCTMHASTSTTTTTTTTPTTLPMCPARHRGHHRQRPAPHRSAAR
jgi:hypothetical protein